jgi:hypothetical protein
MINKTTGVKLKVKIHAITRNFWEYYIESVNDDNQAFGLVCGAEDEMGYIDIVEIGPYLISSTTDLDDLAPAPGWKWA